MIGVLPDRSALMRHKKSQKAEALDLRQLQNAIGFPLAPKVFGLAKKDVDDDLEALGVSNLIIFASSPANRLLIHLSLVDTQSK